VEDLIYDQGPESFRVANQLIPRATPSDQLHRLWGRIIASKGRRNPSQRKLFLNYAQIMDVPGLEPVVGRTGSRISGTRADKLMRTHGQAKLRRAEKTVIRFERLPASNMVMINVIASMEGNIAVADAAVERELDKIVRRINSTFPNSVGVIYAEVDPVIVERQLDTILADARWKEKFEPNQVVWKIHFHGLLYIPFLPGFTDVRKRDRRTDFPTAVEHAFMFGSTGKRSDYSGAHQVRAKPIYSGTKPKNKRWGKVGRHEYIDKGVMKMDDDSRTISLVEGVIGYALKGHFKAPDPTNPTLAFLDWMWLADRNLSLRSRRREIGTRKPAIMFCEWCGKLVEMGDDENPHECPPVLVPIDLEEFYGTTALVQCQANTDHVVSASVDQHTEAKNTIRAVSLIKSSVGIDHWIDWAIRLGKSFTEFPHPIPALRRKPSWNGFSIRGP